MPNSSGSVSFVEKSVKVFVRSVTFSALYNMLIVSVAMFVRRLISDRSVPMVVVVGIRNVKAAVR